MGRYVNDVCTCCHVALCTRIVDRGSDESNDIQHRLTHTLFHARATPIRFDLLLYAHDTDHTQHSWGTTIHTALHDLHTAHMERNSHVLSAVVITKAAICSSDEDSRSKTADTNMLFDARATPTQHCYRFIVYCCMHTILTTHSTHGAPRYIQHYTTTSTQHTGNASHTRRG